MSRAVAGFERRTETMKSSTDTGRSAPCGSSPGPTGTARLAALLLIQALLTAGVALAQQSPHGKLDVACLECHSTDSWKMRADAKFDHASTGFALAGQHKFLQCRSCHADLAFSGTTPGCATCHTDVHNGELGRECLRCHTMTSWVVADMRQKHQETRFPLVGRHLLADCESCHGAATPRRFASTSPECISCHRQDYAATLEPSHGVEGFSVECAACHRVTSAQWKGSFDHSLTAFPLTGAHRALICSECHAGNRLGKLPTACVSCHEDDYLAALLPSHVSGQFSRECLACHTTAAWAPATFDHAATRFALTGKHAIAACEDCHVNGNYALTYSNCYQCHQADFASTVNPDHAGSGFSQDCAACHSTNGWSPAAFNHATTNFALTGAHATAACASCHVGGNYQITYSDCYQCHQDDYAAPSDPNHVIGNFGHDCTPCHTTTTWSPSTFNHDAQYFRIYSGKHAGKWPGCSTCHDAPADYKVFTCIPCHEHSAAEAAGHHGSVPDYTYSRTSCYDCHRGA